MNMLDCYEQVRNLTRDMVKIPSINQQPGQETAMAEFIFGYYHGLDYFKRNPANVRMFPTKNDFVGRHSVLAMVRGTKGSSNKAVVLLSHTDTVAIDDYGPLKPWALDPDALPEKLLELDLPPDIIDDIKSGDYMFGRGALDMKSGAAGHMFIVEYFASHPEELDGVVIGLHTCDEEVSCTGVITALDHLYQLKLDEGLEYAACINSDYSTNYNPGDTNRYIYYGCVGKMLPCFYAIGKETHVGQAFMGLDPNLLLSEITRDISLNTDFCDVALGESTIPPISLRFADTKEFYTVQTAISSLACFNFFTHSLFPDDVVKKSKALAEHSFDTVIKRLNEQYEKYCRINRVEYSRLPWKTKVRTWEELYAELRSRHGGAFTKGIADFAAALKKAQPDMDLRQFSCRVIDEAWTYVGDKSPCVIVFLGSVFHTHGSVTRDEPRQAALLDAVEAAVDDIRPTAGRTIVTRMFYPYIADLSFIVAPKRDVTPDLSANMPAWGSLYTYDVTPSLRVDMPVCTIGTFGRDGHTFTERVDMRHTFCNVPNITYRTILKLMG